MDQSDLKIHTKPYPEIQHQSYEASRNDDDFTIIVEFCRGDCTPQESANRNCSDADLTFLF